MRVPYLPDLWFLPSFFLPIDPQTDVSRQTSVQLSRKEHIGINIAGIIISLIVLLPVITSWTLIILYSPEKPFIWATVSNHTVAIKVCQTTHLKIASALNDLHYLVWQYGLWSFQTGVTKLERFLSKNQHTQRKLLNFENWISGGLRSFQKSEF